MVTSQILRDAKSCFYFGAREEVQGMPGKMSSVETNLYYKKNFFFTTSWYILI